MAKRTLSLALVFTSLVCVFCTAGLLIGIYTANWRVFEPYLVNGGFFWGIILGSLLTILLAIKISYVKTDFSTKVSRNLIFGVMIFAVSLVFLTIFTPLSFTSIFTSSTTNFAINAGRFFLLSGLALILVEFPGQLKAIGLKPKADLFFEKSLTRRTLYWAQFAAGLVSLYLFLAIILYMITYQQTDIAANFVLSCVTLIIGLTSFGATTRKSWLK